MLQTAELPGNSARMPTHFPTASYGVPGLLHPFSPKASSASLPGENMGVGAEQEEGEARVDAAKSNVFPSDSHAHSVIYDFYILLSRKAS